MNTNRMPSKGTPERKLVPLVVEVNSANDDRARVTLNKRFVGHMNARELALEIIARAENPLRDLTRPVACVLLVGKSRSGKTRWAELLAEIVGGELLKINCGNYKEEHHASRLIGSPTGYVGWDDPDKAKKPGKSTAAKLNNENILACRGTKIPVTVVLLDEVNELHESLDNVILSVMDKGEMDLGNNQVADFRNCILVMTTNLGMKQALAKKKERPIGFNRVDTSNQPLTDAEIKESVDKALSDRYEPQWLNRLDDTIIFGSLTEEQIAEMLDIEIDRFVMERIDKLPAGKYFGLEVQPSAKTWILSQSLANNGDAANLRRVIQKHLSDKLGKVLNGNGIPAGSVVVVQYISGDSLSFAIAQGEKVVGGSGDAEGDVKPHRAEESAEHTEGRAIQRRINRAAEGARTTGKLEQFDIILTAKTREALTKQSAQLLHDVTEVYGMEAISVSSQMRAPWAFVLIAEGTSAQMDNLIAVYSRDPKDSPDIKYRKHGTAA